MNRSVIMSVLSLHSGQTVFLTSSSFLIPNRVGCDIWFPCDFIKHKEGEGAALKSELIKFRVSDYLSNCFSGYERFSLSTSEDVSLAGFFINHLSKSPVHIRERAPFKKCVNINTSLLRGIAPFLCLLLYHTNGGHKP